MMQKAYILSAPYTGPLSPLICILQSPLVQWSTTERWLEDPHPAGFYRHWKVAAISTFQGKAWIVFFILTD